MERRLQACVGRPRPTYLARNKGLAFTKGNVEIDSSADVVDSAASAAADLGALKANGATCLRSELTSVLAAQGVTVTSFSAKPVRLMVARADGAFGFRLAMSATAGSRHMAFRGYQLGAVVGAAELDVSVFLTGNASFPLTTAVALLRTVARRSRAVA